MATVNAKGRKKMARMETIAETMKALVREGFAHEFGRPQVQTRESPVWKRVRNAGSRLWLDTGDIEEASSLWSSEFEALTTNNTLLNREVQKGIYDDFIRRTSSTLRETAPDVDEGRLLLEVAFALNAYHGLRLVDFGFHANPDRCALRRRHRHHGADGAFLRHDAAGGFLGRGRRRDRSRLSGGLFHGHQRRGLYQGTGVLGPRQRFSGARHLVCRVDRL